MYELVEGEIIYEMILMHSDSVIRVKNFLLTCILRHKYLKLKQSVRILQPILKGYVARKTVKKMKQEIKDQENIKLMEKKIE